MAAERSGRDGRRSSRLEGLEVSAFSRIADVGEDAWSRAAAGRGLYLSYQWLASLEESPYFACRYLTVAEEGGRLLAALPTYLSEGARGANLLYDPYELIVRPSGHASARIDWFPVLLGGARSGFLNQLVVAPEVTIERRRAALALLLDAFSSVAEAGRARSAAFMYLTREALADLAPLLTGETATVLTGAHTRLEVAWDDFDGYLASLPSDRRYFVRRERARFEASDLTLRIATLDEVSEVAGRLVANVERKHGQAGDPDRWVSLVGEKAARLAASSLAFVAERGGTIVAISLFFVWDGELYAWAWGCDYERAGRDGEYFNLVFYVPIRYAIEHRLPAIHFGAESYRAKVIRGSKPIPLWSVLVPPAGVSTDWRARVAEWGEDRYAALCGELEALVGELPREEWRPSGEPVAARSSG